MLNENAESAAEIKIINVDSMSFSEQETTIWGLISNFNSFFFVIY